MIAKKVAIARYARMTAEELQAATAEFEQELIVAKSRPLTAAERARWNRTRRRPASAGARRKGHNPGPRYSINRIYTDCD
jgi:hypothetical protein